MICCQLQSCGRENPLETLIEYEYLGRQHQAVTNSHAVAIALSKRLCVHSMPAGPVKPCSKCTKQAQVPCSVQHEVRAEATSSHCLCRPSFDRQSHFAKTVCMRV